MFAEVSDGFWFMLVASIAFSFGRYLPLNSIIQRIVEERLQFEERCRLAVENSRIAMQMSKEVWICVGKRKIDTSQCSSVWEAEFERGVPHLRSGTVQFHPIGGHRLVFSNCVVPFGSLAHLRFKCPAEHFVKSSSPWGNLLVPVPFKSKAFEHHFRN